MRIAAGLIGPDHGEVLLDGLHPERDRRRYLSHVGFLTAGDRGLYARYSPRRHLDYCARLAMLPKDVRTDHVDRALERFDLREIADRRADRLSLGQRQRVRLAMTLVHDPDVLLFDEPLNSLDPEGTALLIDAVHDIVGNGGTLLWCSPPGDQEHVAFDRRFVLVEGTLRDA
jgi:ABC-type multidrug transport system ATPase subunit